MEQETDADVGPARDKSKPRGELDAAYARSAHGTFACDAAVDVPLTKFRQGIYLLTTLIQLRTSFPPPPSRPDTEADIGVVNLFSTLPEYQVFGALFDSSLLVTAGVSAVVRWFSHRINSVGVVDS